MNYIYEIFTKPRWELSVLDITVGMGVICGVMFGVVASVLIINWIWKRIKARKIKKQRNNKNV